MTMQKKLFDKKMIYMFLVDIISVTLFILFGFLVAETILPGIIAAYISPLSLFTTVFVLIYLAVYVARHNAIEFTPHSSRPILIACGYFFFIILCAIASFRFGIFYGTIVLVFATIFFFLSASLLKDMIHTNR
jgi:hypothetical protein